MAYREGGMAALRPRNRNASQTNKPAPRRSRNAGDGNDDAEALRRRIEELEPRNALMREVVEARRKRPGCQPAAPVEQREDTAGRPFASDVFTQLDANRHPSGRQRGQAFLQPKPPSVFLTKRLHWRVRVGITRGSISMAAPPWSEFIKNIFDRQQHISLRKIPIRGWPFRAGYHPTHALQQFQSNRC